MLGHDTSVLKKLSIIIPHYNSYASLIKLLESIPQSDDIEVIVIDDNSDDHEHFDKFAKNEQFGKVTFLRNTDGPKGAGTCRNIGLSRAAGDWIIFADSDDYFLTDFYYIISKYFNTDYDVIFFTPTSEDLLTGGISDRHLRYEKIIDDACNNKCKKSDLYLRYKFYVPWSKMIRRKLINDNHIKFDEIIASNDVMFSMKIGHVMAHYYASEEVIYCVTKGKGSLTKTANEEIYFSRLDVWVNRSNFLREHLEPADYEILSISGGDMIATCILYKLGIRNVIKTYIKLRENNVKLLSKLRFSPTELYGMITRRIIHVWKNKKYLD